MNKPQIILAFSLMIILPSTAFGDTQMDTDPITVGSQFDSKPLEEAEQDQKFLTDLWTACIVIVVGAIIARIAFQIVKKRMKKSD